MNFPVLAKILVAAAASAAQPELQEPGVSSESPSVAIPRSDNGAQFVRMTPPPASMQPGQQAAVRVVMRNSGRTTWTAAQNYRLGSQNPRDNVQWGDGRMMLAGSARVRRGQEAVFTMTVRAPSTPGRYNFQWRMLRENVEWFGQATPNVEVTVQGVAPSTGTTPTPTPGRRTGVVRLQGWSLADDQGRFNAIGFTLMQGLRLYKFNRQQLDRELDRAAAAGYHFARVLSMVGRQDAWRGKEIDPDLVYDRSWTDYDEVLAGYLDHAYSKGIRTELTLFADAQVMMPGREARRRHVERIARIVRPRLQTIAYLEIANEPWQNGFDGTADELAEYGRQLRQLLPGAVIALGAPEAERESEFGRKDFPLSLHLDRDSGRADGAWRPVRQPWEAATFGTVPGWTNNEPIGPGSSVAQERDCERIKAQVLSTFISKGFAYVFHSAAGVWSEAIRGAESAYVSDMPCFGLVPAAAAILPTGLPDWTRQNGHWAGSPFINRDAYIDGGDNRPRGTMRMYSATSGDNFSTVLLHVPVGIRLECRVSGPVAVMKLHPLGIDQTVECAPGRTFELGPGAKYLGRPIASPN